MCVCVLEFTPEAKDFKINMTVQSMRDFHLFYSEEHEQVLSLIDNRGLGQ